jgi:hypothetical protein
MSKGLHTLPAVFTREPIALGQPNIEHRVKRCKALSPRPTKQDLERVAAKLLALKWNAQEGRWNLCGSVQNRNFIKMIVGYALTCKMQLPAVANTISEARHQARAHARISIAATDIRAALLDYQIPSGEALRRAFETKTRCASSNVEPQFGRGVTSPAISLQRHCNGIAAKN